MEHGPRGRGLMNNLLVWSDLNHCRATSKGTITITGVRSTIGLWLPTIAADWRSSLLCETESSFDKQLHVRIKTWTGVVLVEAPLLDCRFTGC